jgi:hypothetical protein
MLLLLATSLAVTLILSISGSVIAAFILSKINVDFKNPTYILLSLAILSGLFISSLAAVWSFGVFGSDYYVLIFLLITLLTFTALIKKEIRVIYVIWKSIKIKSLLFIFSIPFLSVTLSSNFIESLTKVRTVVGFGTDVTQNMMASLIQRDYGQTYLQFQSHFFKSVNETTSFDAYLRMLQLPSMREQAGVDYLIYGTRWGLTVPFAQLLRVKESLVLSMQGITISLGIALGIIVMIGLLNLFIDRIYKCAVISVCTFSCSSFLFTVYNGGLAQVFAAPAMVAFTLSLLYLLTFKNSEIEKEPNGFGLKIVLMFSTYILLVTYAEALMVLALWLIISISALIIFRRRNIVFSLVKRVKLLLIVFIIFSLPFIYPLITSFKIRSLGSIGTGFSYPSWPLPSEVLGIGGPWADMQGALKSNISLLIGVIVSLFLLFLVLNNFRSKFREQANFNILIISAYVTIVCLSLNVLLQGSKSNYIYVKSFTYLIPLLIFGIFYSYTLKGKKIIDDKFYSVLIVSALLTSTANYLININKASTFALKSSISSIITDEAAQKELEDFNYLTAYRPVSTAFGVFGNVHWISKAPNDIILTSRSDRQIRIICITGDPECGVGSELIKNSTLSKYGISTYYNSYTTEEFSKLSPKERYDKSFEVVGQKPFPIPKRFLGGSPVFTPKGK